MTTDDLLGDLSKIRETGWIARIHDFPNQVQNVESTIMYIEL